MASARGRNQRHRIERQASSRTAHGILTKATVGERCPPVFGNDGSAIGDTPGVWSQIKQPWDVIELFSTEAPVSLAVSSAGGRATQPYDGGLGNSVRTPAAREQLFEDVESEKPGLIVAYLPDWTREVSELALKLVRRQRAGGRDIRLS